MKRALTRQAGRVAALNFLEEFFQGLKPKTHKVRCQVIVSSRASDLRDIPCPL
jgi:hypothetical protein